MHWLSAQALQVVNVLLGSLQVPAGALAHQLDCVNLVVDPQFFHFPDQLFGEADRESDLVTGVQLIHSRRHPSRRVLAVEGVVREVHEPGVEAQKDVAIQLVVVIDDAPQLASEFLAFLRACSFRKQRTSHALNDDAVTLL